MSILQISKMIAAGGTIATGLISLLAPQRVRGFTGLEVSGPRGLTEIRAILGGAFIGLGVAPLILGTAESYQVLGITYLVIGAIRGVSMGIDRSVVQSNVISLLVEVVLGVVLVI